jgi:hypothetical protein
MTDVAEPSSDLTPFPSSLRYGRVESPLSTETGDAATTDVRQEGLEPPTFRSVV